MMQLKTSGASPFGRKVQLAAAMAGLSDKIEIVQNDAQDPMAGVVALNPLGKIPVLTLEDGSTYYDSRVIIEFLDHFAGAGALIPVEPGARFAALTRAALADGIMEASLLQVYEGSRRDPARRDPEWMMRQSVKVARGLAAFEETPPSGKRGLVDIGLAAALGFLDLRFKGEWRDEFPDLETWLADFAADIPAFAATTP